MPEQSSLSIAVHLDNIDSLFVDPDTNPFENPKLRLSGIQTILNELHKQKLPEKLYLTIYLPRDEIPPDLLERTKDALQRYSAFQVDNLETEVRNTRLDGRRSLAVGLILSVIFIIFAGIGYTFASVVGSGPLSYLGFLFGGFFSLAAWVIIWTPVDTLLYYWRPAWRESHKFRLIARADINILPEG
jgi:hypothetical protein